MGYSAFTAFMFSLFCKKAVHYSTALLFITLVVNNAPIHLRAQQNANASQRAFQLEKIFDQAVTEHGFNGAALVIENGAVMLRKTAGLADVKTGEKITPSSLFNLGDASRQFTAVAIVMLREQGKLSFDAPITQYLPELPYNQITLRHLLTNTSGLPDYRTLFAIHWNDKTKQASNRDLIQLLKSKMPELEFRPGERYAPSPTDYALLASIVERISLMDFSTFVKQNIFDPLGMKSSLVYSRLRTPQFGNRVMGYLPFLLKAPVLDDLNYLSGIVGNDQVYTCLDDLIVWDLALNLEKLAKQPTLNEMFLPTPLNNGSVLNEGFGWTLALVDRRKVADIDGTLGGFSAVFQRNLDDRSSIVVLGNMHFAARFELKESLANALKGKAATLPLPLAATKIAAVLQKSGVDAALKEFAAIRDKAPMAYNLRESDLNTMGLELIELKRTKEAIEIFRLNTEQFPKSFNVWDSLAEAYMADGNTAEALANYKKSLELYPENANAQAMIDKLSKK